MPIVRSRFEERFLPYHDRLFGYGVALSGDRDRAADLLHECVIRAMAARNPPESEAAFRSWLFAILRNIWIDQTRASRRRAEYEARHPEGLVQEPVLLESVVVNAFAVRKAFEHLSQQHREVLALVDISGFSYEETGSILSIPKGTVMSRVSRARRALASLLSDTNVVAIPSNRTAERK
ncbi:DNA-directed RNA polymerase sigma-70 factor [Mesorhizobium tianshanense]|uniref:RNA polymerase sigma-70 factor (ECF subfamily) n=1 Tax=Mesorhizobium tianshanense TaxID=39844 RepID=A0A562MH80_9HYPH|nr:RNA polymerase sigma factor [Mesorhizobium tianshanense]TWI19249.1 RNA polymerase sigma-70 factor (ECF subfamily) [Mesorhizobium tianshanense]GLS41491.1 DNA-directed RNA polymerase sigma-70 factor [Mesorhizobium tianshanense]